MANEPVNKPTQIFRPEALEQASSVEQLDQLMQVVGLKDWLPLASVGALLAAALIWSVVGKIPMFVEAKGLLLADQSNGTLQSVSYFPIAQGKQIQPGDRILIVPDTVNVQEFGGLEATVTNVSPTAVTEQSVAQRIGNPELAQLVYTPASIEVTAALESNSTNATGYQWSMSTGPKQPLSDQIPTHAQVVLQRRSPISYVFPFLQREQP